MKPSRKAFAIVLAAVIGLCAGLGRAAAQPRPSAEVLLPYFEVEAKANGTTTMLAVANSLDKPVDIQMTLYSNWGIAISQMPLTLAAREVHTFDLRIWVNGQMPGRSLTGLALNHLKAALSGQRSPKDNLFYSTPVTGRFTGYVRIVTSSPARPAALWGDYFFLDQARHITYANDLVNLDTQASCPGVCKRHALRFLAGTPFDGGTRVMVWTGKTGQPAASPKPGITLLSQADSAIFDEAGTPQGGSQNSFLSTQSLTLADLGVHQPFGWLDLETESDVFIAVQYGASNGLSLGLLAYCLPLPPPTPTPGAGIHLRKLTNGEDANNPPGPSIRVGDPVLWQYVVENTGAVKLTDINVTDDQGEQVSCPGTALDPGASMTCTAHGTARACQYTNTGTVTAKDPDGVEVDASDPSHYFGDQNPAIAIEKRTNGQHVTAAPGPQLAVGSPVAWTYLVTNSGDIYLTDVKVTDDKGVVVTCPKASLNPGETMTCTGAGTAVAGQYQNTGTVTASNACGVPVSAHDVSYYFGQTAQACVKIKKYTNGDDADTAPGPHIQAGAAVAWDYAVTNCGQAALSSVHVTDNRGVAVACPKSTLAIGETMHCSGSGTATTGQYENIGTVTANPPTGSAVTSSDPSHYYGDTPPPPPTPPTAGVKIKKYTNGDDADVAPGPHIPVGGAVAWDYVVTNSGQTALTNVHVTDSRGVAVTCPKSSLAIGETMHCSGSGTASAGQYENIGTVTANPPTGSAVTSSDPSHYYGDMPPPPPACITIKKYTNGDDADTAPGPHIQVGAAVAWDYKVTNSGQTALTNVHVTDNRGVAVTCPKSTLAVGETMHCSGSGTASAGQYENIGTVTANPPTGSPVTASDPSHYYGDTPPPPPACITIKKYTNGEDADTAPGPHIQVGAAVAWDYKVTNSGQTALSSVHVTDNRGVAVSCPKSTLAAGETMHCSGNGTATAGQYENIGTVTANPPTGSPVTASDPSHYYGDTPPPPPACITIKKYTNGDDADTAPGPHIQVGAAVAWDYKVTNSGQTALSSVHVTDNRGVAVSCPKSTLAAGETMHCSGNGTATAGQYENIGSVTANPPTGSPVTASDPSHYYGDTPPPPPPGNQGCSPGYWKNHSASWTATGYSTSQSVQSVFSAASGYPGLGSAELLSSLSFQGGSDLNGAAGNLLRAGTASLLNGSHPQVSFPLTKASVISQVNAALNSRDRNTMLSLASTLDADNNLSCPLN